MSIQKPLQITQFAKEHYFTKWHIVLIFVVLLVPCSIEYHLQTVTYDMPNDTHKDKITMAPKERDSDHGDSHYETSSHMIRVYDSPTTMESSSKGIVKAVSDTFD